MLVILQLVSALTKLIVSCVVSYIHPDLHEMQKKDRAELQNHQSRIGMTQDPDLSYTDFV